MATDRAWHPAAELLARYRAVLTAAWQARHEMAVPSRLADERAFLPAALSLQETPVHPAPRRTAWALMALFALALGWAFVGQVDIVAVAPGRVVVSDRSKVVQPLEAGVVKAILVRDGERVQAGQVLVELDATQAEADHGTLQEQARAAGVELQRAEALLFALRAGRLPVSAHVPAGTVNKPNEGDKADTAGKAGKADTVSAPAAVTKAAAVVSAQDEALLRAEWADIAGRTARLDAELARRQAEIATARAIVAKLEETLPLARRREADFKALSDEGLVPGHASQDRMRERVEQERDLAAQRARLAEVEAALAETNRARDAARAEIQRSLEERAHRARLALAQLDQQGRKSARREQLTRLVSPVAGTVQQLAVHTTGGVVTPAQPLMVIVPEDGSVTAEVTIDNRDIGFVREGQAAEVKLETFSFTRYGTVPATVTRVTADAVADDKRGAVFVATLHFAHDAIDIDGRRVRLSPGMNLSAEIKTGQRRVIDFLLSPVQRTVNESLRER